MACLRRMWASSEVEDQYKHTASITKLRFQRLQSGRGGGGGGASDMVEAEGIRLFRVDSLEGDAIGTACLVQKWKRVPAAV